MLHSGITKHDQLPSAQLTNVQVFLPIWPQAFELIQCGRTCGHLGTVELCVKTMSMKGIPELISLTALVNPIEDGIELGVVNRTVVSAAEDDLDEVPDLVSHGVRQDIQEVDLSLEVFALAVTHLQMLSGSGLLAIIMIL